MSVVAITNHTFMSLWPHACIFFYHVPTTCEMCSELHMFSFFANFFFVSTGHPRTIADSGW